MANPAPTQQPPGLICLAIEISNPPLIPGGGEVALASVDGAGGVEILARRSVSAGSRHDDALMPAIEILCQDASIRPRELGSVAVSAGPGGYTAVRIGVTTAKMIAMATGAELTLVPTPMVAWLGLEKPIRDARACRVVLGWKRNDAYCVDFAAGMTMATPATGRVRTIEEIARDTTHQIIADPRLLETLMSMGASAGLHRARLTAECVARLGALLPRCDALTAAPIYPREPEAVSKWRELRGA